jgi:anti-repressor protein
VDSEKSVLPDFNSLLPIHNRPEVGAVVDARALHKALEVRRDFSNWLKGRLEEAFAVENQDYCVVDDSPNLASSVLEYNNYQINYALTLDIAKHIAMLEKTPIGRKIRQYFIESEKHSRQVLPFDPTNAVSVLEYALSQARQLEAAQPKAAAFDHLMDSSSLYSVAEAAKLLGTGQVRLFTILRDAGVLMSHQHNWNQPYQQHIDAGRFEVKTTTFEVKTRDGKLETRSSTTTWVTARGLDYIRKLLEKERAA